MLWGRMLWGGVGWGGVGWGGVGWGGVGWGGVNCTVDQQSCTDNALLFFSFCFGQLGAKWDMLLKRHT